MFEANCSKLLSRVQTVQAPGPGTYDATDPSNYKRRLPHYTMGARVFPPGDNTIKPGPGAHRPELVSIGPSGHWWLACLVGWVSGWVGGCWFAGWLVGWLVGWLGGWLVGWLVGWLGGWLGGWLVGWFGGLMVGWLFRWFDGWLVGSVV